MPGGQWLLSQYALQNAAALQKDEDEIEESARLGRFLAEHTWNFPYLEAGTTCVCGQPADLYRAEDEYAYEPAPPDDRITAPNGTIFHKGRAMVPPSGLLLWCETEQKLFLFEVREN